MKFLLIILTIRYVLGLFGKTGKKKEGFDRHGYEDDWSNPSEHNVWW